MKLNLIFVFLFISIPAFSYAHEKEDIIEIVHKPLSEQELKAISIQDEALRSSRNFLGYENIFGNIKYGDPVEKLGKDRKCNSVSVSGGADNGDNGALGCRVVKDYGTFVEIPVYDVEYMFQKKSDKYVMTSANVFLYKSEQYFRDQYPDTATESSEKSSVMSAPKRNYATKLRCGRVASKLSETWGRPETNSMDPVWIDKNNHISAALTGVACNVLRMESME
jgi:hypothetical protein